MIQVSIFSKSKFTVDRDRIRKTVVKTIVGHGITKDTDLSVSIVGEREMKNLHKKYLETEEVTDVISFPLEGTEFPDNILHLGDIVVCYPVAVAQASQNNRLVDDEIDFLVDHGCLHLMGIHHD
jgi:probable rRNA maturation factor